MFVRQADLRDARSIAEVHIRSWHATYVNQIPEDYLAGLSVERREIVWGEVLAESKWPLTGTLVLVEEPQILGFANIGPSRDEEANPETGEVRSIYLSPEAWGKGGGRSLMDDSLGLLREAGFMESTLWVLDSNHRARRFYEIGGWRADGSERSTDSRGFVLREVRYWRSLG